MVTLSSELQDGELLEPTPVLELHTTSTDDDSAPSLNAAHRFQLEAQTEGPGSVQSDNIIADRNAAEEENEPRSEREEAVENSGSEDSSSQAEGGTHLLPSAVQSSLHSFMTPQLPNLAQAALQRLAAAGGVTTSEGVDSPDDFRPLKKRRITEVVSESDEEQEGQTCSICFEPWSNSGGHRIASLKCGHLFGFSCIDKWLKGQSGGKCPQCNAKAKKADIRVIFAKAVSVVDTTERDRALKDLEAEKGRRISAEKAEAQAILQHTLVKAECERLREEIRELKQQLDFYSKGSGRSSSAVTGSLEQGPLSLSSSAANTCTHQMGKYTLQKTVTVSQHGGARVLAFDALSGMLVASRPSNNQLMPGHGLLKLSLLEPGYNEYVPVHSAIVRDVSFCPRGDGMVVTAGMDKSCKLTSMHSNSVVQSFHTPVPAWACTWNLDDPNYLYCGLQNGVVNIYDIRNTASHVEQLIRPGGGTCPITSLAFVPLCRASLLNCSGLLSGTLDGSVFWEKNRNANNGAMHIPHQLCTLPEGACTCLSFEPITRHCLASFRPSKRSPHSRHILCQIHNVPVDRPFSCRTIHQFTGGTAHRMLSRSQLFKRPGSNDCIVAAFGDEASNSVQVWDVSSTSKLQQLTLEGDLALDLLPCGREGNCLAVLTASKVFLYQWTLS